MPRGRRFNLAWMPQHLIQRGNNRQPVFFREVDYRVYLACLLDARRKYDCSIHAYALMTNHVHLLASAGEMSHVSAMMQHLGRRYVRYVNKTYGRSGTLWEGRFKSSLIDTESYYLTCCRYIESNPVRAGLVGAPGEYPWSSYRFNALGLPDALISPHEIYEHLAALPAERSRTYRESFGTEIGSDTLTAIRESVQYGWPLGSDAFKDRIAQLLSRVARPPRRGRPKKVVDAGAWT